MDRLRRLLNLRIYLTRLCCCLSKRLYLYIVLGRLYLYSSSYFLNQTSVRWISVMTALNGYAITTDKWVCLVDGGRSWFRFLVTRLNLVLHRLIDCSWRLWICDVCRVIIHVAACWQRNRGTTACIINNYAPLVVYNLLNELRAVVVGALRWTTSQVNSNILLLLACIGVGAIKVISGSLTSIDLRILCHLYLTHVWSMARMLDRSWPRIASHFI